MKKLINQSDKNTPEAYNSIFKETKPNWQDKRRWRWLMKYYKRGSVVDLGCLFSGIYKMFSWKMDEYTGIDLAGDAIYEMNKRAGGGYLYEIGDITSLTHRDNLYDYAILGEVLEHLEEPERAIKEAFRILKPGGVLAVSVPLEEAIEPGAVDSERHLWSYTEQDIKDLVAPYSNKIKTKVLRSKWFPRYKYSWPTLLTWAWKK